MKKKTIFKIFLIFITFSLLLAINNVVNANITIDGDQYTFYYSDVLTGMKLFCVKKDEFLPTDRQLNYGVDGHIFLHQIKQKNMIPQVG